MDDINIDLMVDSNNMKELLPFRESINFKYLIIEQMWVTHNSNSCLDNILTTQETCIWSEKSITFMVEVTNDTRHK